MSKKSFLIFIIVLLIAGLFLWGLFAFLKSQSEKPDTAGGGTNFFAQFNPFGQNNPAPTTPTPIETPGETPIFNEDGIRLRRISSMPVAGFGVYQKERYKEVPPSMEISSTPTPPEVEFYPAVRYAARATGNIYQTFADNLDERRFSSTLVPKVYEAYFGNGGEGVIMRYLKPDERTIVTFTGSLPKENLGADSSLEHELSGTFLPENISDLVLSPDASKIFYLFPVGEGVAGITAGVLGDKKSQVFDSPFTEWLAGWPRSDTITLTTKPSYLAPGQMYMINVSKKELVKVLGDIPGLTTLMSPDGKLILYADSSLSLYVYNTESKTTVPFSLKTLPEKCVWGKASDTVYCSVPKGLAGANYPDIWYRGQISFSDEIWKLNIEEQNTERVSDLVSAAGMENMDNIKLSLDEKEGYLFFVNKKDSMLWELALD